MSMQIPTMNPRSTFGKKPGGPRKVVGKSNTAKTVVAIAAAPNLSMMNNPGIKIAGMRNALVMINNPGIWVI
ncbi:unnamed protein product [marine sediment metagenome]|uniref:Uncharacterized protein n=1 Tax=marine sediment metagenome TaxID=412755 RepID=X1RD87_9ZZZZ